MSASGTLRIGLAQMEIAWEDKAMNRERCAAIIRRAAQRGIELLVFPERTLTGFSMAVARTGESMAESSTIDFFRTEARRHQVAIVFGLDTKERGSRKGGNVAVAVDRNGRVLAQYAKTHLFSFSDEQRFFMAGNTLAFFSLNGMRCALAICYDLRFPGLFEAIAREKPDVIFVIANWPTARIADWDALLKARALDTASYIVGVNRVGKGNGLDYNGHSSVYDPSGERLLLLSRGAALGTMTVDRAVVAKRRAQFPSFRDKRHGLYRVFAYTISLALYLF